MTHSKGFRCKTRMVFARAFRQHGVPAPSINLVQYKRGDYVDILVNGAIHKGMPHRYYHGKTGKVFNVNPHSIGVEFNKKVGPRFVKKYIHVRVEHIRPSASNAAHIGRVKVNDEQTKLYKAGKSEWKCLKRIPEQPLAAQILIKPTVVDIAPVPYKGIIV
ncbi:Ribosomal protein L21 [Spironucleus salmonicida]|uniref:Ribosomal protein L21 n=2 Tax=Spironucleus salmonicida TaxID=348837 RepID=A0A9P8LVX4_9EUKA|nr:Ribosomal protein L21 [Spironucleus salmonicida]